MKTLYFFVSLFTFLWLPGHAQIFIDVQGSDVHIRTDLQGQSGYKGCTAESMEERPAYIYELYQISNSVAFATSTDSGCGESEQEQGSGMPVDVEESIANAVQFQNVLPGVYQVKVLCGKKEGCQVFDEAGSVLGRSIVYRRYFSSQICGVSGIGRNYYTTNNGCKR